MKLKLKPIIITSTVALAATISLAVGLSYVPIGDKKIERSSESQIKKQEDNSDIPGLPKIQGPKIDKPIEKVVLPDRTKSTSFISKEEKVNYVAIGDSISAGFDSSLEKDYPGSFNPSSKTFDGISFPVYLAKFINEIKEGKLESFKNFAQSTTTFEDWILMLDYDNQKSKLSESRKEHLNKLFGGNVENYKNEVIKKLNSANLVTITLGANDFFEVVLNDLTNIPLIDLINEIKNNNLNYAEVYTVISEALKNVFDTLSERMRTFNTLIKKHCKTSNINYIGYPLPLIHIFDVVDTVINKNKSDFSISQILLDLINRQIRFGAINQKINYISIYDNDFWHKYSTKVNPNLFDIHPGSFGYKKIAQDIFIKLILESRNEETINKNNIEWNSKYLSQDFDSFLLQIEVEKPYEEVEKIFGKSLADYIFTEDEIYNKYCKIDEKLKKKNYFNRVLNFTDAYEFILDKLFDAVLSSNFFKKIDKENKLNNFFRRNNNKNINQVKSWIIDSKFIPEKLLLIEEEYLTTDWDSNGIPGAQVLEFKYLADTFKKHFSDEESAIKLITSFFNIEFLRTEKTELIEILEEIIQNAVNEKINHESIGKIASVIDNTKIEKYISKTDVTDLLNIVLNSKNIKKLFGELLINVFQMSDEFAKAKKFKDLIQIFINNSRNQEILKKFTKDIIKDMLKDSKLKKIVSKIVSVLVVEKHEIFHDINKEELTEIFVKLLSSIDKFEEEFNILETFVNNLIDELIKSSFKDVDFKGVAKKTGETLKSKFQGAELETSIIKIIKIIIGADFKEYDKTFAELALNVFDVVNDKKKLPEFISKTIVEKEPKTIEYIEQNELTNIFENTFKIGEFDKFISELISALLSLDATTVSSAKNIKDLSAKAFNQVSKTNALNSLFDLVQKVLTFEEIQKLLDKVINKDLKQPDFRIEPSKINELCELLCQNGSFKALIVSFVQKGVLENDIEFKDLTIDKIITEWLKEKDTKEDVKINLQKTVRSLLTDNDAVELISLFAYKTVEKAEFLFKGISKRGVIQLFNMFIKSAPKINEIFKFDEFIYDELLAELQSSQQNKTKFNYKKLVKSIKTRIKEVIDNSSNKQVLILNLIKSVFTKENLIRNKDALIKFASNAITWLVDKKEIGKKIYNKFSDKAKDILKAINGDDFQVMFAAMFKDTNNINDLIEKVINIIIDDYQLLENAQSIYDIAKIILVPKTKISDHYLNLELMLTQLINNETTHRMFKDLWEEHATPYNIDTKSQENINFVNDLLVELPDIVKDLGILPKILSGISADIEKNGKITNIAKAITSGINFKDFGFWKALMNGKTIQKHNIILKEDIKLIVKGITSNDELVDKFITDFTLDELLVKSGLTKKESYKFWKQLIQSPNIRDIVYTFLDELFGKIKKYAKTNSLIELFETFFRSSSATAIKESLKKWYDEVTTNSPSIFYTLGKIWAESWRKKGFTNKKEDDKILEEFVYSIAKAVSYTNILDDMIDAVFEQLCNLSQLDPKNIGKALLGAIKKGGLKFISNADGSKVVVKKIFDNIGVFNTILSHVSPKAYSDFINLAFASSIQDENVGIYKVMFHLENNNDKVEIGFSGLIDIIKGKIGELISVFVGPLLNNYFNELSDKSAFNSTSDVKKNISGYQAVWRSYAFISSVIYATCPKPKLLTDVPWKMAENYIHTGYKSAYDKALNEYYDVRNKYSGNEYVIGINNDGFWAGSLKWDMKKYNRDHLYTYIKFQDEEDWQFNTGKKFKDVLIKDMHNGFMP